MSDEFDDDELTDEEREEYVHMLNMSIDEAKAMLAENLDNHDVPDMNMIVNEYLKNFDAALASVGVGPLEDWVEHIQPMVPLYQAVDPEGRSSLVIEAILALEGLELTDETAKAFFMGFSCAAGLANVPTNIGTGEEITSEDIASVLAVARFQLVIGCSLSALMTDRLDG